MLDVKVCLTSWLQKVHVIGDNYQSSDMIITIRMYGVAGEEGRINIQCWIPWRSNFLFYHGKIQTWQNIAWPLIYLMDRFILYNITHVFWATKFFFYHIPIFNYIQREKEENITTIKVYLYCLQLWSLVCCRDAAWRSGKFLPLGTRSAPRGTRRSWRPRSHHATCLATPRQSDPCQWCLPAGSDVQCYAVPAKADL